MLFAADYECFNYTRPAACHSEQVGPVATDAKAPLREAQEGATNNKVALLSIGLLRGLLLPFQREWLHQLTASLRTDRDSAPPDIFGVFELARPQAQIAETATYCAANQSSAHAVQCWCSEALVRGMLSNAFRNGAYVDLRLLNETELQEQGRIRGHKSLYQYFKTAVAFGLLQAHERATAVRYAFVMRARIDAAGELPLTWFAAAVKQLGPPDSHGALMYNDFAWLARRETAGQLANVWQETAVPQCSENGAQLFPTTEPIDFCRVADSAWPTSCSLFVRTIALPFGDEVLGAKVKAWGDEFPRVLPTMMCANGSIYESEYARGNVSTTSRRSILPFGGPCNPQAILGTHLFAKHRTPPFVKALCLRSGPNRLLGSKNKSLRKDLPC